MRWRPPRRAPARPPDRRLRRDTLFGCSIPNCRRRSIRSTPAERVDGALVQIGLERLDVAEEELLAALRGAEAARDAETAARAQEGLGSIAIRRGNTAAAIDWLERVLADGGPAGPRRAHRALPRPGPGVFGDRQERPGDRAPRGVQRRARGPSRRRSGHAGPLLDLPVARLRRRRRLRPGGGGARRRAAARRRGHRPEGARVRLSRAGAALLHDGAYRPGAGVRRQAGRAHRGQRQRLACGERPPRPRAHPARRRADRRRPRGAPGDAAALRRAHERPRRGLGRGRGGAARAPGRRSRRARSTRRAQAIELLGTQSAPGELGDAYLVLARGYDELGRADRAEAAYAASDRRATEAERLALRARAGPTAGTASSCAGPGAPRRPWTRSSRRPTSRRPTSPSSSSRTSSRPQHWGLTPMLRARPARAAGCRAPRRGRRPSTGRPATAGGRSARPGTSPSHARPPRAAWR